CQTDFNPSGQIEWFTWKSNYTQIHLSYGSNLQLNLNQLQSSLEMIIVNSKNLWIINKQYSNDYENHLHVDDYMNLKNVNFHIHLWKFTCIASSLGFDSQSANRFIIQAGMIEGNQQETVGQSFVLLGIRQQGVPVILRELMLPDGFNSDI
ncbi:unnamed protein product, partial [Schistosoma margrebowiei]